MPDIVKRNFLPYSETLIPNQFLNATNTKALLDIFLKEDQLFQDELMKLFEVGLDIDNATGYQLTIIGRLSGVDRFTDNDEEYRQAIKFQRVIDNGNGTIPEILDFVKTLTGVDDVLIFNHYPASISVQVNNGSSVPSNIAELVDKVTLAGVSGHTVIHLKDGVGVVPLEESRDNYNDITGEWEPISVGEYGYSSVLPEASFLAANPTSTRGVLPESYTSKDYI